MWNPRYHGTYQSCVMLEALEVQSLPVLPSPSLHPLLILLFLPHFLPNPNYSGLHQFFAIRKRAENETSHLAIDKEKEKNMYALLNFAKSNLQRYTRKNELWIINGDNRVFPRLTSDPSSELTLYRLVAVEHTTHFRHQFCLDSREYMRFFLFIINNIHIYIYIFNKII